MYGPECEKCEEVILYGVAVRLVGGVHTVLCPPCQTEWDGYVSGLDVFKELGRLEAVWASIVYARELVHDVVDIRLSRTQDAILACKEELRQEGLRWLGRDVS